MRFGLILGKLAMLKKKLGWLWASFEAGFFHVFRGKLFLNIFFFVNFLLIIKKNYRLKLCMIVYCSTGDTSLRDFYIMTLVVSNSTLRWRSNTVNRDVGTEQGTQTYLNLVEKRVGTCAWFIWSSEDFKLFGKKL